MFSEALLGIRDKWQNNFRVKVYVMTKTPYGKFSVRFTWRTLCLHVYLIIEI